MADQQQIAPSTVDINVRRRIVALVSLAILAATPTVVPTAQAQTFQVIHSFTGGVGGYYPGYAVVRDRAGNLYGTTAYGGNYTSSCNYVGTQTGCGVVFKMSHHGSGWIFNIVSSFDGANGYNPSQPVTVAPDGSLYGTTFWGGSGDCHGFGPGCGTIFRLQPPAAFCRSVSCPWTVSDLHQFLGASGDGAFPEIGSLTLDSAGNIYGTTANGGLYNAGTVYELTRNGNGWDLSILYNFSGNNDGGNPFAGVVFDSAGNMYGTTCCGGSHGYGGVVYKLTHTQSGWTQTVIHSFYYPTDGAVPSGNLLLDASGNLYGITDAYGANGGGTVWELSPGDTGWNFTVLYSFSGAPGYGPVGGLLMDGAGNLYGATEDTDHPWGEVFKLSPSNGGWSFASLYTFTGGADGGVPSSQLMMDSAGNLFGTAAVGGSSESCPTGCGVVFEITQ